MERRLHPSKALVFCIQELGIMCVVLVGKYIKNQRNALAFAKASISEPDDFRLEKELIQPAIGSHRHPLLDVIPADQFRPPQLLGWRITGHPRPSENRLFFIEHVTHPGG